MHDVAVYVVKEQGRCCARRPKSATNSATSGGDECFWANLAILRSFGRFQPMLVDFEQIGGDLGQTQADSAPGASVRQLFSNLGSPAAVAETGIVGVIFGSAQRTTFG